MDDYKRNWLLHGFIVECEVLVLGTLVLFPILTYFKPVGIMTTGKGDLMRFRIAEGQDDVMERCKFVQVDFGTKWCKHPEAFFNRDLVKYEKFDKANWYAWHEIQAPSGTTVFRIAFHWKENCKPSELGPELSGISLGKRSISWKDMRSEYELYTPLTCPCYWFRPAWFLNVSALGVLMYVAGYFVVVNVLVLLVFLILRARLKPDDGHVE